MALPLPVKDTLTLLVDEFSNAQDPGNKDLLQRKVIGILKDHYQANSDVATQEHFEGLEEKCRVLKNDELADALLERYDKLKEWPNRWKFDILSFLLQLEDNPIEKTRLEDLQELIPAPLPSNLTWKDLLENDPYIDETIWQDINYTESDSDESEWSIQASDNSTGHGGDSELADIGDSSFSSLFVARADDSELEAVIYNQESYMQDLDKIRLTEVQLIRETLFMLQGLPSSVYTKVSGKVQVQASVTLCDVTAGSMNKLLNSFCETGSRLIHLRDILEEKDTDPLIQAFQASLLDLLEVFDIGMSKLEQETIISKDTTTTLLSIWSAVNLKSKSLGRIGPLLDNVSSQPSVYILDALFNLVVQLQNVGDSSLFKITAEVFFKCLNTYLRPVKAWMGHGNLEDSPKDFFIKESKVEALAPGLWQVGYKLDLDVEGHIRVPRFLHAVAQKAFFVGKGISLLSRISPMYKLSYERDSLPLTFLTVCGNVPSYLQPFEDSLASALETWTLASCRVSDEQILDIVKHEGKFDETLSALQHVYFFKNGASSQQIASRIFDRMDSNKRWLDRFVLTNLYREQLSRAPNLDVQRVAVRVLKDLNSAVSTRSVQQLAMFRLDYHLSWSTAIVIQPHHLQIFQKVYVLLLQLKRASQLLNQHFIIELSRQSTATRRRLILSLRQRLRWFSDTLVCYLTVAVLERTMKELHEHLEKAKDLDELIEGFDSAILSLLEPCMLAGHQQTTHNAIVSLLDLVVLFCDVCSGVSAEEAGVQGNQTSYESEESEDEHDQCISQQSTQLIEDCEDILRKYSVSLDQLLSCIVAGIQETSRTSEQQLLQDLLENLKFGIRQR